MKVHPKERAFACAHDGCTRRFSHKSDLTAHVRDVHDNEGTRDFICAECLNGYKNRKTLQTHHSRAHPGVQGLMPPLPDYFYKKKNLLK
jgi:uncharacterized Zn-finger protein